MVRWLALAVLLSACSSHHDTPDLGVADLASSGLPSSDLASSDLAVVTCTSIGFDDAPFVTSSFVPGDSPTLSGGTLLDGTYVLSTYTYHGQDADLAPATIQVRGQFRVTGTTWAGAIELDGIETLSAGFFKIVGNQLVLANCANKFPAHTEFAATPTTLTQAGAPTPSAQAVLTFTRK